MNCVALAGLLPVPGGAGFAAGTSELIPAHPASRIENRKTNRRKEAKVFTAGPSFSGGRQYDSAAQGRVAADKEIDRICTRLQSVGGRNILNQDTFRSRRSRRHASGPMACLPVAGCKPRADSATH